ncbi:hypothetical protein ACI2JA_10875 [Alkalihalobacillus sp. NPDC078783]
MSKKKNLIITAFLTVIFLLGVTAPALAASWSMTMSAGVVNGNNNGNTYSLNAGKRTVTGSVYVSKWNDQLTTSSVNVTAVLYKKNTVGLNTKVATRSVNPNSKGHATSVAMSASNQPKGTYYLYFSKGHNYTTVKGSGTIN